MVKAFDEVVAMAEKHQVSNRIASYMLAIDRVAAMHRMRGLYA
jgi:glutamate dehydrogenase (NAD(P)+)